MIGASAWMVIQDDPFKVEGTSVVPPSARAATMSNADIANKAIANIKPGGFSELMHEDFLSVVRTANYMNESVPVIAPVYDAVTETARISAVEPDGGTTVVPPYERAAMSNAAKALSADIHALATRKKCGGLQEAFSQYESVIAKQDWQDKWRELDGLPPAVVSKICTSGDDPKVHPAGGIACKYSRHFDVRFVAEFNFYDEMARISRCHWDEIGAYINALHERIADLEAVSAAPQPTLANSAGSSLQHAMSACTLLDAYGR